MRHWLAHVPPAIGCEVLGRRRQGRRALLKSLLTVVIAVPIGHTVWRQTPAGGVDVRTRPGQRREVSLPDGSQLTLNTASAVGLSYTERERQIDLVDGEILIATAPTSANDPRPLLVRTRQGVVRALGTRFEMRALGDGLTRVRVFEDAVAVRPSETLQEQVLEAGQALSFNRQQILSTGRHDQSGPDWQRGLLISEDQPLAEFLVELARYRSGVLRCDPEVAELRLSGVFQLDDTDQIIDLLAEALPVRIERRLGGLWVTIKAP